MIKMTKAGSTTIAIDSTATVYTDSFPLKYGLAFGIALIADSPGTVDLKVQLEESDRLPTTENTSDTHWVIADGVADIYTSLADETKHIKVISPVPMPLGRLKITGGASNNASTTLSATVFEQESLMVVG